MNACRAFSMGTSGIVHDDQMQAYSNMIQMNYQQVKNLGGWLAEGASNFMNNFTNFVSSRAWDLAGMLRGQSEQVGYYDIGTIMTVGGLQQAQGVMRDYIMAMPGVWDAYQAGEIEGYGGEVSAWCQGSGEDNIFYRRQMHGLLQTETVDGVNSAYTKHYHDSVAGGGLSVRERLDLANTRRAVNLHMANGLFDFTSPENNPLKSNNEEGEA